MKANAGDIMNDLNRRDDDRPVAVGEPCGPGAQAGTAIVRSISWSPSRASCAAGAALLLRVGR